MKRVISASLCLAVLLISCKKESINETSPAPAVTASWEPAAARPAAGANSFTITRTVPALTADLLETGAVLVFVRSYGSDAATAKPVRLPFTFFASESDTEPVRWNLTASAGKIDVSVTVPAGKENYSRGAAPELQYFVLDAATLAQNNLTPVTAAKLSYSELQNILN
jgi:hypothetical protein